MGRVHFIGGSPDETVDVSWVEEAARQGGNFDYNANLSARVSGATFEGTYTRTRKDGGSPSLLGLDGYIKKDVIGYVSDDKKEVKVISKQFKDDFEFLMLRQELY